MTRGPCRTPPGCSGFGEHGFPGVSAAASRAPNNLSTLEGCDTAPYSIPQIALIQLDFIFLEKAKELFPKSDFAVVSFLVGNISFH